jgi:sigma-B regulation protein RsbU (phosphoserine phosphatase)
MPNSTKELIKQSKILIVDDSRLERQLLRQVFENFGFENIIEAINGQEGWDKTLEHHPDLVLLDVEMPIMDGFTYCQKARTHDDFKKLAILVQTGLNNVKDKHKIFASGATDYVTKPTDPHEIIARSSIHLENSLHVNQLMAYNERVRKDLEAAKRLLDITLPHPDFIRAIRKLYGIEFLSFFESSFETGGDFFGIHKINDDKIGFYIFDFSGHGIDSALNALRLDAMIKSHPKEAEDPSELFKLLNENLVKLLPTEQYATMFYGIVDTKQDIITYTTAASTEAILINDASTPIMISGKGFPLGVDKNSTFTNKQIPFKKGDVLFLYSDAVIETENNDGKMLSTIDLIKQIKTAEIAIGKKSYNNEFDSFVKKFNNDHGQNIKDDLTINMICRVE